MCAAALRSDDARAPRRIAVIGAGWAGCAAATELALAGHRVTLIESSRTLGGRARAVDIDGRALDNGQHILLGAYTESLRLMRLTGIDIDRAMLRLPLQMRYLPECGGMDFRAARLPAPLHMLLALIRASGLERADKMALARFSSTARWMGWRLDIDCSVDELLQRFEQTERLIRLMWRPLCIAALNTPPERASAHIFLQVLRDSLGARRAASDMLLPRVDLTTLFPQAAAAFITRHGGEIQIGTAIRRIAKTDEKWRLAGDAAQALPAFDGVVIATPAAQVNGLLVDIASEALVPDFDYEPITTCYLQYPSDLQLDAPFYALIDDPAVGEWGQFVFDRGQLDAAQAGLLAVVISVSSEAIANGKEVLAAQVAAQLAKACALPRLAQPEWTQVISEKRATFSCTPSLQRPIEETPYRGLVLAGDYLASDYPATLESAARSGVKAATLLGAQLAD
ncbi:MAG TPA: hydroxysqualene dehydroxylase HpnE [Oxalicibacterium sp.]|nr:hydroxysqualene dehydroxylase HpnE [Oxalicibacterium sp.]